MERASLKEHRRFGALIADALGIDKRGGIRSIQLHSHVNDVATYTVEYIASRDDVAKLEGLIQAGAPVSYDIEPAPSGVCTDGGEAS